MMNACNHFKINQTEVKIMLFKGESVIHYDQVLTLDNLLEFALADTHHVKSQPIINQD